MGLMKLNQILKKYKQLHKKHVDSWGDAQKRIRSKGMDDATYQKESYDYQVRGCRLLDEMMKELEGQEVFPKNKK